MTIQFHLLKTAMLVSIFVFVQFTLQATDKKEKTGENGGYEITVSRQIDHTEVKDQASSGTCWSFSSTSFIESEIIRITGERIDLSEMFFVNYAYRQKAQNYIRYMGKANFSEGGQAHDVMNTALKFGLMPESAYRGINYNKTYHQHEELVDMMTASLETGLKHQADFSGKCLDVVNATLDIYLGQIPDSFQYNGKWYNPNTFATYTGINPNDYVEITSFSHHPFYTEIDLEIPDNWSHGTYFNLPLDELIQVMDYAFEQGYSVNWDGDVSEDGFSHKHGLAIVPDVEGRSLVGSERAKWEELSPEEQHDNMYKFDKPRPEKVITQALRQEAFDKLQTTDDHLMHLVGTASDQNGTRYYITKNSWAANSNKFGGMLYMSDAYVRLTTIAIQVHKNAIPPELRAKLGIK